MSTPRRRAILSQLKEKVAEMKREDRRGFFIGHETDYKVIPGMEPDEKLEIYERQQFEDVISFGVQTGMPLNKIISDYFNILSQNPDLQEEHEWELIGLMSGTTFIEAMNVSGEGYENSAFVRYKDLYLIFTIRKYLDQNRFVYTLNVESNGITDITGHFIYLKLLKHAMSFSDLKGSYFSMPRERFEWEKKPLEKRNFSDIYLPESTMNDLKLYIGIYENKNKLMRYLFAGVPGTAKTESTLVIANILKSQGVTIIKTVVDELLKEKIELAEMLAPSILLFDDIDLSLGSRTAGVFSHNLQLFLDCLDGTDKIKDNVGIIATTNSIDLLDLAAQRPGRFDKLLSFDEISEKNIKDIILKSFKNNFQLKEKNPTVKLFTDDKIIKLFHSSKVTGSHVYHNVKMIKERIDFLQIKDIKVEWLCEEFQKEIKSLESIKQKSRLNDKLSNERKKVGFGIND